jgi:hypothetical protein
VTSSNAAKVSAYRMKSIASIGTLQHLDRNRSGILRDGRERARHQGRSGAGPWKNIR